MSPQYASIDESSLSLIATGGEGEVYSLNSRTVLKLYLKDPDAEKRHKMRYIAALKANKLRKYVVLPFKLVKCKERYGYLMAKVPQSYKNLHELFSPSSFQQNFPKEDYRLRVVAALNIAKVIRLIHAENIIIGDINQSGVLVNDRGNVRFIDADSYQFKDGDKLYKCSVGVPDYTPPELQGQKLTDITRTKEHDAFGLAVLIFQLLFMGRHPFAGVPKDLQEHYTLGEAIKHKYYAYSDKQDKLSPPPGALSVNYFPKLNHLFEAAFLGSVWRPSADNWVSALTDFFDALVQCSQDSKHYYHKNLSSCPFCAAAGRGSTPIICTSPAKKQNASAIENTVLHKEAEAAAPQAKPIPAQQIKSSAAMPKQREFGFLKYWKKAWIPATIWLPATAAIIGLAFYSAPLHHSRFTSNYTRNYTHARTAVQAAAHLSNSSMAAQAQQAPPQTQIRKQAYAATENIRPKEYSYTYQCYLARIMYLKSKKSKSIKGAATRPFTLYYENDNLYRLEDTFITKIKKLSPSTYILYSRNETWIASFINQRPNYISYVGQNIKYTYKCNI